MTKFRNIRGLLAGLAGVALLLGGVAVASNMGFKFVPVVPDTAGANAFNLSLPWNNNYTNAGSLLSDTNAARVSRFNANSTLTSWTGTVGTNFNLVKGHGYVLFAAAGGGALNPVIVGSHDPNFTLTFTKDEAFNASAPYHQTFNNAGELLTDLRTALGSSSIARVSRFNANSTLTSWTGTVGTNFNLVLGASVIIFADANTGAYSWPHY